MVVQCEVCRVELSDKNLCEIEDSTKKIHLICTRCKKLSQRVLKVFDTLEWEAFVQFVKRQEQGRKELTFKD